MGVASVEGYGPITRDNAADIYRDIDTYRELEPAQKALVDRYVPDDEKDKIDYELQNEKAHDEGSGKIKDTEKSDEHGNQTANVAATTAGNFAAISGLMWVISAVEGFSALALSLLALAFAGAQTVLAKLFDNAYSDRNDCRKNAGDTNAIIDGQSEALVNSMNDMNEDYANYQKGTENLTRAVNDNNSNLADLQVQLADCEAAGDTAGAARISGEIKNLQKPEFKETEELEETRQGLEEYAVMAEESKGVSQGTRTVSDFMKGGYVMAPFAALNAGLNAAAALWTAGTFSLPKIVPFFPDAPSSAATNLTLKIGAGLFISAALVWADKAKSEIECGIAGDEMGSKTAHLEGTIEEHTALKDETAEGYVKLDEDAGKDMDKGVKQANQSSTSNDGRTINYTPNVKTDAPMTGKQV